MLGGRLTTACGLQGATLQDVSEQLNAMYSNLVKLHESLSDISHCTEHALVQGQQIGAMVAALLRKSSQQEGGFDQFQRFGAAHQLPLQAGMAVPFTKAERARQRQQMRWEARRRAQRSEGIMGQPASTVLSAVAQHSSAARTAPASAQNAAPLAADLALHPWQEWQGAIKTITSAPLHCPNDCWSDWGYAQSP